MIKIICDVLLLWRCRLQLVGGHNTGAVVYGRGGTLGFLLPAKTPAACETAEIHKVP